MVKVIVFSLAALSILVMAGVVSAYPAYKYNIDCTESFFYTRAGANMMFGAPNGRIVYRETPNIMMKSRAYFSDSVDYPHYVMNRRSGKVYYVQRS